MTLMATLHPWAASLGHSRFVRPTARYAMKIRSIEPILLKIPFKAGTASTGFGDKPWTAYDMLVVRVETDEGIIGWGESWGYGIIPATKATIEHVVAPHFIGRDAAEFANLFEEMRHKLHLFGRNGTINYALAGIEIALWDIWGKVVDQPVHALLGGAHRLQFSAYASLMPYRDPARVGEITAQAVTEGYPAVKLHEIDVPQVRAARSAGGDGLELTVDTNCPWTALAGSGDGEADARVQHLLAGRAGLAAGELCRASTA
jgi:D-galactarolactone cycloisomerase